MILIKFFRGAIIVNLLILQIETIIIFLSYRNTSSSSDYLAIAAEKNDCEIIVVNKALT